jgi:NADH-quinone oxidoreductase subunit J
VETRSFGSEHGLLIIERSSRTLNIKLAELQEDYYSFVPISLLFGCVLTVELVFLFESEYTTLNIYNESSQIFLTEFLETSTKKLMFTTSFGASSNLETIAVSIFNDNLFSFIIAGYVLLLALIAAIILTIQKTFVSKTQNVYSQILADYNNTIVNYK